MSKSLTIPKKNLDAIERLIAQGDVGQMNQEQRLGYMRSMCKLMGISMLGQPFDFIKLNGKTVMYANAKCAAQLRATYKVSIKIVARERIDFVYVVTAQARIEKGREDESIGAMNTKGLTGEALANALMKAETKAKRRATLSLCGLGMLDSDTAKELAEQEARIVTALAVEESQEKLDGTTERPEFETELASPSVDQPVPASSEYKLRTVKGAKGKALIQVPLKTLTSWLKFYDKSAAEGEVLHAEVQDDAFHIRSFLEEAQFAQPTVEAPNG